MSIVMGQTVTERTTSGTTNFDMRVDDNGIATLTFHQPDSSVNTFTRVAIEELVALLGEVESRIASRSDQVGIRGLIFASGKEGNFIAGADISLIQAITDQTEGERASRAGQLLFDRIQDLPIPTLALINGSCLGGGLELALSCDYRVAADTPKTTIGLPETQLGVLPGWGGTYRLPRVIGLREATKMILSGSRVNASKALKIGLVDLAYPSAFCREWTYARFVEICRGGEDALIDANRAKARRRRGWFVEQTPVGRSLLFRTAARDLQRRTGGHYPAPVAALRVLRRTTVGSLRNRRMRSRAAHIEAQAFGRLAAGEVSANLTRLFFAREGAKRQELPNRAAPRVIERALVVGAGVMGGRIAWLLSSRDVNTVMKDIAWEAVQKGYQAAKEVYANLIKRRKYDAREVNLKLNRIHGTLDYTAIGRPDIVIEAVVERMGIKKAVLGELERLVSPQTIIVTNTSALSVSEMAGELAHPERFAGMHFFNPVDRMPLVEVICGTYTNDETRAEVARLALRLGKTPVVVQDRPGFLVNRLLLPYLNEAAVLLSEGVRFDLTDRLFERFGWPMGPYTLLDEVGLDVGAHVADTLSHAFGERMRTAEVLNEIRTTPELWGKKCGSGFYTYRDGRKGEPNPAMLSLVSRFSDIRPSSRRGQPNPAAPSDQDIFDRAMLSMVNEAAFALEERVVATPTELDLAMIMGTGFPPFRGGLLRWADRVGIATIRDRLVELRDRYGSRFTPAPRIEDLSGAGRSFYHE